MPVRHRLIAIVLAAVLAASCAGYQRVTLPAAQPAAEGAFRIAVGDTVRLTLTDHQVKEFRVTDIESDALVGENGDRVPLADIVVLERRTISKLRTIALVLSPAIALGVLMGVIYVGCSIGDCR